MHAVMTRDGFLAARGYVLREGRPLERSLFRRLFEGGDDQSVLDALAGHQMPDGGFRGMGEGDRDASSPVGTTVAFQHLMELGAGPGHPVVRKGISYLLSTYDRDREAWPRDGGVPVWSKEYLSRQWGNPCAEIVACLIRYGALVPPGFLAEVTRIAIDRFRELPVPVPWFCDLCYLRLARELPDPAERDEIYGKVSAGVLQNLELDHGRWHTGYFMKPYWFAMRPDCRLHDLLRDEIDACLDFDIGAQEADGSARLTFRVGDDEARRTWKSIWTLESLKVLRDHGRIEGMGIAAGDAPRAIAKG